MLKEAYWQTVNKDGTSEQPFTYRQIRKTLALKIINSVLNQKSISFFAAPAGQHKVQVIIEHSDKFWTS